MTNDEIHETFECKHDNTQNTKRVLSNGAIAIAVQCMRCGRQIDNLKKTSFSNIAFNALPDFDHQIYIEWHQAEQQAWDEYFRSRKENYNDYLSSDAWKYTRQTVFERSNYMCEGCLETYAEHVHHLTYSHFGHELLFQLVALCKSCHDRVHFIDADKKVDSDF